MKIENLDDVKIYFDSLTKEYGNTWHPDDIEGEEMDKAFEICEKQDVDIYEFAMNSHLFHQNQSKFNRSKIVESLLNQVRSEGISDLEIHEFIENEINNVVASAINLTVGEYQHNHGDCLVYFRGWEKYASDEQDGGIIHLIFDQEEENLSVSFRNTHPKLLRSFSDTFGYQQIMDKPEILINFLVKMIKHCKAQ
jgi:hypothetical protein